MRAAPTFESVQGNGTPLPQAAPHQGGRRRIGRGARGGARPGTLPLRRRRRHPGDGERDDPGQPPRCHARPGLGARLPRPVLRRLHLRLHVRAERHAQLPAASAREERRRRSDQPDLRLREGNRPVREPGVAPLGPPHLSEGPHPQPPVLRRSPGQGSDDPQGLQGVGGGGVPAKRRRLTEVRPEPPGHGRLDQALVGRRDDDRREDARERRAHLQRRGGRDEAPGAGLRPRDGRGDARRRCPGDQDARRHAAARCRADLRLLPLRQHARAARCQGATRGASRRDPRQPRLRQLRLAHRPSPRPPDGDGEPDGRLRPLRRRAHRPSRDHRHELDLHEDAGCALDRRRAAEGNTRRRDQRRLHADGEQGRRGDHPSRRYRHGAPARRRTRADREEPLRQEGGRRADRPAAARPPRHRREAEREGRVPRLRAGEARELRRAQAGRRDQEVAAAAAVHGREADRLERAPRGLGRLRLLGSRHGCAEGGLPRRGRCQVPRRRRG